MEISLDDIRTAAELLSGVAVRTPILRLGGDHADDIWIKPEVLQPVGSFKIRGAYNAIVRKLEQSELSEVMTVSAGNMSQAVAWSARELGLRSVAVMPDSAPKSKIEATQGYGAEIQFIPRGELMAAMLDGRYADHPGLIHPFADLDVATGNGTAGLEIVEDLPEAATVIVPVGGGGLILGIASAIKSVKPSTRIIGVQPEAAPGLIESWRAGRPLSVDVQPTITDGAGAPFAVEAFFPTFQRLLSDCVTVTDDETRSAIYRLATKNKIVAEGAGALSVAAALRISPDQRGVTVCVVSGGSIDPQLLSEILSSR